MTDNVSPKYDLRVEKLGDLIISELTSTFNGVTSRLYMDVLDTKDESVREALIEMGWTPPPEPPTHRSRRATSFLDCD